MCLYLLKNEEGPREHLFPQNPNSHGFVFVFLFVCVFIFVFVFNEEGPREPPVSPESKLSWSTSACQSLDIVHHQPVDNHWVSVST